jgi:hypothetical protein
MGFPQAPSTQVLMIALTDLSQSAWSGLLPPVTAGEAFWANSRQVPSLTAAGQAELAPEGTPEPPHEPRYTAHGSPGFGAGTSNSSR